MSVTICGKSFPHKPWVTNPGPIVSAYDHWVMSVLTITVCPLQVSFYEGFSPLAQHRTYEMHFRDETERQALWLDAVFKERRTRIPAPSNPGQLNSGPKNPWLANFAPLNKNETKLTSSARRWVFAAAGCSLLLAELGVFRFVMLRGTTR